MLKRWRESFGRSSPLAARTSPLAARVGRPRVLHIVPALFGSSGVVGGAERYVLELARAMAPHVPTTLLTFGREAREEHLGELRIRVLGPAIHVRGQAFNPIAWGLIPAVLGADIIHCHQQHVVASSLAALVGRLRGRRLFVSELGGGGWDISAYVSTDRLFHGHLHISEYSRRIAGQTGKPWAHVVYGGVDTDKFTPAPGRIDGDRPVVYVGRLLPHKGVNYLVEALPPEMPLEIIGRPYDPRFLTELERLAADKRVTFRLRCEDAEMVEAYQRALCVVLPSVYRSMYGVESSVPELLGQTLLEGMACGAPVICTRVASMPEVVEDGVSGFIVEPNDPEALRSKLLWLAIHPELAQKMGTAGRERVLTRFTWPRVIERCFDAYGLGLGSISAIRAPASR